MRSVRPAVRQRLGRAPRAGAQGAPEPWVPAAERGGGGASEGAGPPRRQDAAARANQRA